MKTQTLATLSVTLFLTVVLAVFLGFVSEPAAAQGIPSADLDATSGFSQLTTSPMAVGSTTATIVGDMPAGCHTLRITAYHGDINIGGSDVASGVYAEKIASGSTFVLTGITVKSPDVYLVGRSGNASATLIAK